VMYWGDRVCGRVRGRGTANVSEVEAKMLADPSLSLMLNCLAFLVPRTPSLKESGPRRVQW
jgi:hypothetical protein